MRPVSLIGYDFVNPYYHWISSTLEGIFQSGGLSDVSYGVTAGQNRC